MAVHPAEESARHELYFMCDDLKAEIQALSEKGIRCSEVDEARRGSVTSIRLPGGGDVGLLPAEASNGICPHLRLTPDDVSCSSGGLARWYGQCRGYGTAGTMPTTTRRSGP